MTRPSALSSNRICSDASLLWEEIALGGNPLDSAWRKYRLTVFLDTPNSREIVLIP